MARWPSTCAATKITNNHQAQRATPCIVLVGSAIYARAPSLCSAFLLPASRHGPNVHLRTRPAEPPCTCAALTRPHGPHTTNPIHSSPRAGRGCLEDLLKRRCMGGRGLPTTDLLGRMIGQAQRPRYVVIVFLHCRTPLFVLLRHAHLPCNIHYSPLAAYTSYDSSLYSLTPVLARPFLHYCNTAQSPTRPGVTSQHFLFAFFCFAHQHIKSIARTRHRLATSSNTR